MTKAFGPKRSKGFRDKYLAPAMIVAAFFFTNILSAQVGNDTTKYTYYRYLYGNKTDRLQVPKVLVPPADTSYSKMGIAVVDSSVWIGNGTAWFKPKAGSTESTQITIAGLRALDLPISGAVYQVTNRGYEGLFYWDESDHSSVDDTATILTRGSGGTKKVYKRVFDHVIYPEWWGALGDNTTNDGPAFNKMFRWMERQTLGSFEVKFAHNRYYTSTRITLPYTISYGVVAYPFVKVNAPGVTIRTDQAIDILYRMPATDADVEPMNNSYKLLIDGLYLQGDRSTSAQTGLRISLTYGGAFTNMHFNGLDTGAVASFITKTKFENCFFTVNKSVDLKLQSLAGLVGTQTVPGSASNATEVISCRFFEEAGAYAAIMLLGTNKTVIDKYIIEGSQPRYGIYSNYLGFNNGDELDISNGWFEGYSNQPSVNFRISGSGTTKITNVKRTYADTLFDFSGSQSSSSFILDGFNTVGGLAAKPFRADPADPTFSGKMIKVINSHPGFATDLLNPVKWVDGIVPQDMVIDHFQGSNLGYTIASTTNIEMWPQANQSESSLNNTFIVRGSIFHKTDNVSYYGGLPGLWNYRPKAGFFGTGGVYIDKTGGLWFGDALTTPDVGIINEIPGQLSLVDQDENYQDLKARKGIFQIGTGYENSFPIGDIGNQDFPTKEMLIQNVHDSVDALRSSFVATTGVDSLSKITDSIRVFKGGVHVYSLKDNTGGGGGSAFGDTVVHGVTLKNQGITGSPLDVDSVLLNKTVNQRIDSIVNNSVGVRSVITAGTNVGVSGTGTAPDPYVISATASGSNPHNALTLASYSPVKNSNLTASRNANYAAFNSMITAAVDGQMCIIPDGDWYFPASLLTMSSTAKKINLVIIGDVFFAAGGGFVLEGNYHYITGNGTLDGGNTGATDSTAYAAYAGTGIYMKNCDKCMVNVNLIQNFKYGIKYGGESTTTAKGTQYGRVWFNQIRNNYADIYITTTGTTTDASSGNWATSGMWFGGQLGRHTLGTPGVYAGVYGVLIQMDASSNQGNGTSSNPFNYHNFYNIGFEGMMVGFKAHKLWYSKVDGGRLEDNAVDSAMFDLRENSAGGLDCKDNNLSTFPGMTEAKFAVGGKGNGTIMPALMTANGVKSGLLTMPNGRGGYINFIGDEPFTRQSTFDMFAIDGFGGTLPERYALHVIRVANGVDDFVSFDGKQVTVTGTTYTVANNVSRVLANPASTQTITLPAAASWSARIIKVKNIHASTTVTISGPATGNTLTLAPNAAAEYISNGTTWYDYNQNTATGGSSGRWNNDGTNDVNILYKVGIGRTTPTAFLHAKGNGLTNGAPIKIDSMVLIPSAENGAIEFDGVDFWGSAQSVRRRFLMAPTGALTAGQTVQVNPGATGVDYVWPNYTLLYNSNAEKSITSTSATTILNGGAITIPHSIGANNTVIMKGAGWIINGGSNSSITINYVIGSSVLAISGGTLPSPNSPSLSSNYCEFEVRITPTGTANQTMVFSKLDIIGVGKTFTMGVIGNTWNTTTPVVNMTANFNIASQEFRVDHMMVELMTKN